jgi:hypothetical protein
MPNSPEAEHLQRAVDAVKEALLPEKKKEPILEPDFTVTEEHESEEGQSE